MRKTPTLPGHVEGWGDVKGKEVGVVYAQRAEQKKMNSCWEGREKGLTKQGKISVYSAAAVWIVESRGVGWPRRR